MSLRWLLERVQWRLSKVGVSTELYYLFLEGLSQEPRLSFDNHRVKLEARFLGVEEMEAMAAARSMPLQGLLSRLQDGNLCFGVKHRGSLIAYTWCDLQRCDIKGYVFALEVNEAYLFDAYTVPSWRRRGIAPYMRYRCYEELAKLEKNTFYSFTDYFDHVALRFKEKLNAKPLELVLVVTPFKRWRVRIRLKRYDRSLTRRRLVRDQWRLMGGSHPLIGTSVRQAHDLRREE